MSPARAAAAPTISEFTAGLTADSFPTGIAAGPDGNVWFTQSKNPGRIGRITPAGTIREFTTGLTVNSGPVSIAAGPDGNLWFAEDRDPGRIGRITPAGEITEFTTGLTPNSLPIGIAAGPDGNLWFTEQVGGRIGRITPSGTITEFSAGLTPNSAPTEIAAGPDGNLWFAEALGGIGRITPAGTITEFTTGLSANGSPFGIAAGPDGNLWFTENVGGRIGRITPAGTITEFTAGLTGDSAPVFIAAGPDGNLWFTEELGGIGRITPAGAITEFTTGLTPNSLPTGIAAGPDGSLWFTEQNDPGRIGRITAGPGVVTGEASGVSSSAATLAGAVRPNGQLTTFQFQFGTTASYGSETPAQLAGQDAAQHPVSAALTGLSPNTIYHYRLVATNPSDTTVGADRTFTTAPDGSAAGPPAPPPKASFAGSRSSIRVDRRRRFSFSFRADPGLTGTAVFRSANRIPTSPQTEHEKRITLAKTSFSVPASGKVTLRIRLSPRTFGVLQLNHKIRTRLTITLANAAGLTSTASNQFTLKAPKRRRR